METAVSYSGITRQVDDPSPCVMTWRSSLRSRSPSPTNRSSQPHKFGAKMSSSQELEKSKKSGLDFKATNGSGDISFSKDHLTKSMSSTTALEQEYIKSLQQQVYLLELENNHLRQQATKATQMHPVMQSEAENMLAKLKDMQSRIDNLELELYRKDGNNDVLSNKIAQLTHKLKDENATHGKEKEMLMDELVQLRKERDQLERDLSRKDHQVSELKDDLARTLSNLRSADTKVESLRAQLDSEVDKVRVTELALAEKREAVMKMELDLRTLEDRHYSNTVAIQDQAKEELREEIRVLRQKLKEAEMAAENDRFLRSKLSDDSSHLVQENAQLNQRVIEIQRELEREKSMRGGQDDKRSQEILDITRLREREKELKFDVSRLTQELNSERERAERYLGQIETIETDIRRHGMAQQDQSYSTHTLESTLAQKRLAENEFAHTSLTEENTKLARDKEYLMDHIANLQQQVKDKEAEISSLRSNMSGMESRLVQLERIKTLEEQLQSQRWEELEKLADTLKSHAHLMASSTTTGSPVKQTSTRFAQPEI